MTDISLDTLDIHTPELYLERGYPFAEWDYLREHAPIFWYERDDIDPFYAITRHQDVLTISKNADVFVNSQRLRLQSKEDDARQEMSQKYRAEMRGWDPNEVADFIFMDDPRHRDFRLIVAKRFTPAALRPLEGHFARMSHTFAQEFIDKLQAAGKRGEETDFVKGFAEKLPLAAIGEMMGLPDGDWKRLKQLTNVMIGAPESSFYEDGEDMNAARLRAAEEMTDYMVEVVADRRARGPGGDDLSITGRLRAGRRQAASPSSSCRATSS